MPSTELHKLSKRKREILNAAATLFRYNGYAATSMRDLSEAVGLEVSSLYSHIKSKEEILITLCFHCAELYSQGLSQIMEMDTGPMEKLDFIVDLHINIAIDHPSSITVFNDEWKHLPTVELESFLTMRKEYEKSIQDIIQEGIVAGVIYRYPVDIIMNTMLSAMRWIHYSHQDFDATQRSHTQRVIKNLLRNGIEV